MDRDTHADDNAEHLYRYISHKHPETNFFFLLRKESHDWNRLKNEGFNLIPFSSHEHKAALTHAIHLISSQTSRYVTHYLPHKWYKDVIKSKYTFLQHGIIQNDLSIWLNTKQIDCFITTAKREFDSISVNHTAYKFTEKEVKLTGLPRHDTLLSRLTRKENIILIMPTWREYITGKTFGNISAHREINQNFEKSNYFRTWASLLNSEKLKRLSQEYNYKIIFFPHSTIQPYLHLFDLSEHITCLSHQVDSIQKLFQRSALMITDYSSVAFEMGMLQRGIIYYQFDHDEFFSGGHTTKEGYFDYEPDGFGPVCYNENDVFKEIEVLLENSSHPSKRYLQRMKDFFEFHDTNNCQRVFEVIQNLNKP